MRVTPRSLGLNPSREFARSQAHKACEQRRYHVRSGVVEVKQLGGVSVSMELCASCDVWVERSRPDWRVGE